MRFFPVEKWLKNIPVQGDIPESGTLVSNTIRVAWPSVMESFFIALVGIVGTAMVGVLGPYAIAAVGLTTQPKFIGLAVFLSLNVAVSSVIARRHGEGKHESANHLLRRMIFISIGLSVVISVVSVVFADRILRFAGSSPDTHEAAVSYFKIIMAGIGFTTTSLVINAAQRGVGNTKVSMNTNLVANLVNVLLNYLLVTGKHGFPALGVPGSAIATVIGSAVACGMSLLSLCHKDGYLQFRYMKKSRLEKEDTAALLNVGSSALAEQLFQRIGFLLFVISVAKLGTVEFAAHQIGMNFMGLTFSFGEGLAAASIALVGQSLGQKRQDLARLYGTICQRLSLFFSFFLSVFSLLCGRWFYEIFTNDQGVISYGVTIMRMMIIIVFLQVTQVVFSGCLRGAGDTKVTAVIALVGIAIVRPIAGWLFSYPLGLGLIGAWIGLTADQLVRFVLSWLRFRTGKWTHLKL